MILLTHFPDGEKAFNDLGDEVLLIDKESCKEKFEATLQKWWGDDTMQRFKKETYGFLSCNKGKDEHPLYRGFKYYLLSNDGQVIKNLSFN